MKRSYATRFWAVFMAFVLALMPVSPISVWNNTTDVKAAGTEQEWLTADETYVSALEVKSIMDGQEPFDDTDGNGNDSSSSNLMVRSYDTIKYSIEYSIETYMTGNSYKNGYIWFEVDLPYKEDQVYFDTGVMNWMSTAEGYQWTITKNPDGTQKLKCAKKLAIAQNTATAIPGKGTVEFVMQVRGMRSGQTIQPTFYAYMDYNKSVSENSVCPDHVSEENGGMECKKAVPDEISVTSAPSYNIQLRAVQDIAAYKEKDWDFSTGNELALNKEAGTVKGRVVAFAITLQLYNPKINKGIKGIEYPQGPITFDVDMSSAYLQENSTRTNLDEFDVYKPLVWSYGPSSFGETIDGRSTKGTYGSTYLEAPLNSSGKTIATDGALSNQDECETCWNGGTWRATQSGRKISFTVSDYEINPNWFPTKNVSALNQEYKENPNIGCFSAGELFVVVPYGADEDYLATKYGTGTVELKLSDSNMKMTSLSGTEVTTQTKTTDDTAAKVVSLSTPGTYTNRIQYAYGPEEGIGFREDSNSIANGECYRNGEDTAAIGSSVAIIWGGVSNGQSGDDNRVEAGDFLLKFDDEALEIDTSINPKTGKVRGFSTYDTLDVQEDGVNTYYYAVKANGQGWADDDEMEDTKIEDLRYYPTLEQAKQAGVVVGILWSFRCNHCEQLHDDENYWYYHLNNQDMIAKAYFKIKNNTDLIDNVYQTVPESTIWRARDLSVEPSAVPTPYEVQTNSETQPTPTIPNCKNAYQKAYYQNGNYDGGHTSAGNGWEFGDSLYIIGYTTKITKEILQKDENSATDKSKSVYDLDAGQDIVDYKLTPTMHLSADVAWPNPTTVTIVDTLPLGVQYMQDSAVMGATYTPAANGFSGTFVGGTALDPVLGTTTIDGNEHATLTWVIPNVIVQYEQPSIFYKVRIDTDVENEANFSNTVTISTTEDTRPHTEQNGNMDRVGFSVVKLSNMSITKRAVKARADVNDILEYDIIWSNNSDSIAGDEILMDILPVNGKDSSSFDGNYEIEELLITSPDPDYEVYYTTDANVFGTKPNQYVFAEIKAGSSNGITWTKATVTNDSVDFGSDSGNVTSWAVLVDVPAADKVTVRNSLKTDGNKPGDIYYNRAGLDDITVSAPVTIVGRRLSGTTWVDVDQDGVREAGETLLSGVTVTLYDAQGNIVTDLKGNPCTMQTDANGDYLFENLPAGTFHVEFTDGSTVIGDYTLTDTNSGDNEWVDSDAEMDGGVPTISGIEMPIDTRITNGTIYEEVHLDAGFFQAGNLEISKTVEDAEAGEEDTEFEITLVLTPPAGYTYTQIKDESGNVYTVTDNKVVFTLKNTESVKFVNLPAGTSYVVQEKNSPLFCETISYSDNSKVIEASGADEVDVLNQRVNRILEGTTWLDENKDGQRDNSEELLSGVKVTVYDEEGNIVKDLKNNEECTMLTDQDGNYRFENLPAGTFTVVFEDSQGVKITDYTLTVKDQGNDDTDSDAAVNNEGNPQVPGIDMPEDDEIQNSPYVVSHVDAGFYRSGKIRLTKTVLDADPADGNPAFNITLTMKDTNGNPLTEVVINGSNTTLTNGTYTFALKDGDVVEITDIPDGSTYTVAEDEYVLYRETVKYSNTDAIKTIDATSVDTVEVENQRINRVLTGTTWIDADQDGIRDDDEDLLPGLTVTLYDENGDMVVDLTGEDCITTTDENGDYRFDNLPAGEITVVFTDENGDTISEYTLTTPNAGNSTEEEKTDSDAQLDNNGDPAITGIDMPEDEDIVDSPYIVEYQDAGFYQFGDLQISKTVEAAENELAGREFEVTLTLTPPGDLVLTQIKDEQGTVYPVNNGKVVFTVKAGTVIKFVDIPAGTSYTVAEKDDPLFAEKVTYAGNKKSVTPLVTNEVTLLNKRVNRVLRGTTWLDEDEDGYRDSDEDVLPGIKVTLYDEDGDIVVDLTGEECITTTDENGNYEFDNLPPGSFTVVFTDEDGNPISEYTLTVPDEPSAGDDADSDADYDEDGNPSIPGIDMPPDEEITGTYIVEYKDAGFYVKKTTAVSGEKTWVDNDDEAGARPDSITIQLLADGKVIETKTVTADDNWSWIFTDLPLENGRDKIVYKIKEVGVEGYKTTYDGYDVTNTYDGEDPEEPSKPEPPKPEPPTPNPPTPTPPTPPAPMPSVPRTGDDAPIGMWAVLMLLGLAGMVGAGYVLTKNNKDE